MFNINALSIKRAKYVKKGFNLIAMPFKTIGFKHMKTDNHRLDNNSQTDSVKRNLLFFLQLVFFMLYRLQESIMSERVG